MPNRKTPNPVDKHVGTRVRMCRMVAGMSQTNLADELDVTFQQVQKYENGVNRISASRLQLMAAMFNVPVDFFFEGLAGVSEKSRQPAYLSDFVAEQEGLALAKAFMKIANPKVRKSVVKLAEAIATPA
jgi:transcriptional regulator with XRE-family HTH domain